MNVICKGVGIGLTIKPENYKAGVILSLHEEEGDDDAASFIVLPADKARDIATTMMARAIEAQAMEDELEAVPLDDRDAAMDKIITRIHGHLN
jgi:hypothetical protein